VIGASFDAPADNAAFATKYAFPFPLLCDVDRSLGLAYGACDRPDASTARRVSCLIGEDGRVLRYYATVAPRDHPTEVLRDLSALAQGD
jgi:thioredoxin-dependent peroxiredoxin